MSLERQVASGRRSRDEADALLARVGATESLDDLADRHLVVESVVEDLEVKKGLFTRLGKVLDGDAVLCTNTSTLPVVEIAMATAVPEQVCGMHFFNPAPTMHLVEIARPLTASDATVSKAREFAEACGKQVIEVDDRAGFVVNALLFPYLNSAVRLLSAGVAPAEQIDTAMRGGCNFPIGPLALLDLVGLDTSVAILDALHHDTPEPQYAPAPRLRRMVSAGQLGRKSGRGFFEYCR